MVAVSTGASTTSSTLRTSRAICWARVTKPWPTSAHAHVMVATPSCNSHRASEESSNPSENMRFLKPTASASPRTTWVASAVRPAPPGRDIGSSGRTAADGLPAHVRITSATGRAPVTTCPVSSRSPGVRALCSRRSTGSIPRATARRSIWASWAMHVWTAPKPRMAPQGGLLVRTTTPSTSADGTR